MHWLDPDYLPETSGAVAQFLVNPHGDIDGMILKNGTEVHFPPHLSRKIAKSVCVGDKIKVRGVRPRDADVIAGVALETSKGLSIVDDGPDHEKPKGRHPAPSARKPIDASGIVMRALHGPKGEIRGVLLESGEAIRFPKHEAEKFSALTKPGAKFAAQGDALVTKFGTVINAHKIGATGKKLRKVGPKH
jgi:hypothetical protein